MLKVQPKFINLISNKQYQGLSYRTGPIGDKAGETLNVLRRAETL